MFNGRAKCVNTHGLNQNLDTSFVFVVPATMLVVNTQNGFQIGQQVFFAQPFTYYRADYRGTTEAATNQYFESDLAHDHWLSTQYRYRESVLRRDPVLIRRLQS